MNLTKQECTVLKGYAIVCIVMHNLWHLMGFACENEFSYSLDKEFAFWRCLSALDTDMFANFFSYWGWHGVSVFIFLSGYGLVRKYESSHLVSIKCKDFVISHFLKLFILMAPAFLLYLILFRLQGNMIWIRPALAQFSMLINIIYHPSVINPGVYWFWGLTLQFYLFYWIFIYRRRAIFLYVFALVSLLSISLALYLWGGEKTVIVEYIRHNSVGWIYLFLFGVWFARNASFLERFRYNWCLWCILVIIFILGGLNAYTWIFTPLFVVLIMVKLVHYIVLVPWLLKLGMWLGKISASLFVVHPIVRMYFRNGEFSYGSSLLYLFISCFLAYLYSKLNKVLVERIM